MDDELTYYFDNHPGVMPGECLAKPDSGNTVVGKSSGRNVIINEDIYYKEMYNLKNLVVSIEKCDKIWETLKLIRNIQNSSQEKPNETPSKLPTYNSLPKDPKYCMITKADKIRYFHCNECGKDFKRFLPLRVHAFKVHTYYIPQLRKRKTQDSLIKNGMQPVPPPSKVNELKKQSLRPPKPIEKPDNSRSEKPVPEAKANHSQRTREVETVKPVAGTSKNPATQTGITCILCKRVCKNIRKHIIEYHKILYPDSIIESCTANMVIKSESVDSTEMVEEPPVKKMKNVARKQPTASSLKTTKRILEHKRKVLKWKKNIPEVKESVYYCDCGMAFKDKRCLSNHTRIHIKAQLTTGRQKKKSLKRSHEEDPDVTLKRLRNLYASNGDESAICECGRTFRNPHTLYLHKSKCKPTSDGEDKSFATRNSSDRDSGIGISITIKKKNNSYEIVNKDHSTNNSVETSSVNSSDIISLSGDESVREDDNLVTTHYSKDHSVLKIEAVEDDVDVDIEDDVQLSDGINGDNKLNNEDGTTNGAITPSNKTKEEPDQSLTVEDTSKDQLTNEIEMEESNSKPFLPSLKELCRKSISGNDPHLSIGSVKLKPKVKPKPISKPAPNDMILSVPIETLDIFDPIQKEPEMAMLKTRRRRLEQQCLCGKKFRSTYFLNLHIKKLHPKLLNCAYCDTTFEDFANFDTHNCEPTQAKFRENSFKLTCPTCKVYVDLSTEKFDKHTMDEHFDSVLPFQCLICSERFANATKRRLHFRRHKVPPCEICNKSLHYELQVKHNYYHEGIGYPCHKCKRAYSRRSILVKHRTKVHSNMMKQYVTCDICLKEVSKLNINKHKYRHQLQYNCLKCNEMHVGPSKLQMHIDKKHKDDYPYLRCKFCDLQFMLPKLLEKHISGGNCSKCKSGVVNGKMAACKEEGTVKEEQGIKKEEEEQSDDSDTDVEMGNFLNVKSGEANNEDKRNDGASKENVPLMESVEEPTEEIVIASDDELEILEDNVTCKKVVGEETIIKRSNSFFDKKMDVIPENNEKPEDCNDNSDLEVVFTKEAVKAEHVDNEGLEVIFTKSSSSAKDLPLENSNLSSVVSKDPEEEISIIS